MRLLGRIFILLLFAHPLFAQESMPAEPVICYYKDEDSFTEILPDRKLAARGRTSTTSTIQVTYVDFPEAAKSAYQQAMDLWAEYLYSNQPIRIKAIWTSLANNVLATTGATRIYKNFSNARYANVWYPVALAEALSGKDLNEGDFEIEMKLNNNVNWYYGTDGKAQSGKFDLITIVMHEIAHGLGFSSTMKILNSTQGQYGQSGSSYIYDLFLQNSERIKLTDSGVFGNPSTDLKTALTSNTLFFGLRDERYAKSLPRLYSPFTFNDGSSISHFDESTYPQGNPNSLMSPSVRTAEVNQDPGDLLLRCLQDMGWQIVNLDGNVINGNEQGGENLTDVLVFPNPVADAVNVAFPLRNSARNVSAELFDVQGRSLHRVEGKSVVSETYTIDLTTLPEGVYLLKVVDDGRQISRKLLK